MTQRFAARLMPADRAATPYLDVPVEIGDGVRSMEVELRFDPSAGVIDLGCEGPNGWRGWSGGARHRFVLTEHDATWGYVPGPLEPGIWHVVLGLHRVAATGVSVELTVHAPARRDVEPDPPAPPSRGSPRSGASARRLPSSECLTWWACDFHSHTLHSDGALSVDQLAARAAGVGLDVLAVTDHNTVSAHRQLPAAATRYGLTVMPGQEMTTDRGHANALGTPSFIDFRQHPNTWIDAVGRHGGVLSVNHPVAGDCSWQWDVRAKPRVVEAMHSSWRFSPGDTSIWAWLAAWGHHDLTVIGGSDFHVDGEGVDVGSPTTWVAAPDPSEASILAAVTAGHTSVSAGSPMSGPVLLRLGDEIVAVDADGAIHTDWEGRQRVIHGPRVRIRDATPGIHRLVSSTGHTLAMTG